jgi:hypothetical protein
MRRFAFFLSSEEYQSYPNSEYCHADSDLLRDTLILKCDYLPENSITLKLGKGDGISPSNILSQINELVDRSEDGDSILFFFAGHGVVVESQTYLILPDTSSFNVSSTAVKLSDINYFLSKNKRVNIRVFDCCHSGQGSRGANIDVESQEFMRQIMKDGNDCSITLASCAVHEKSYPDEGRGNGVFTGALVDAINRCKPDTEIFAEVLKIEVCNAVQRWCADRGKRQTPTLSAQITGNISIARRIISSPPAQVSQGPVILSLAERLKRARGIEVVNEEFYPELRNVLENIETEFPNHFKAEDLYGALLNKKAVQRAQEIPEFLSERILNIMKDHQTMHLMEVRKVERRRYKDPFSTLFEYQPIFDTYYCIEQNSEAPDSFLTFESKSDGYLPSSGLFFYVSPLQASICILSGYYFDKSYNGGSDEFKAQKIQAKIYSPSQIRERKYLEELANLKVFYEFDLGVEIGARLETLERELRKLQ